MSRAATATASAPRRRMAGRSNGENAVDKMLRQYAGRITKGLHWGCPACRRFLGHDGGCPGVRGHGRRLPICHENFRTGRMEWPYRVAIGGGLDRVEGQEKFWRFGDKATAGRAST